ncbi:hypothetical protein GE09DRAFT_129981 [Coniochaeta sp. 2T2.1]|nr:hypothetical protein GE09DRAFT_129981 [Coniochaeta sp. 2T2.1]
MYSPGLSPNGQGNGDDSSTSSPFPPSQPGGVSGSRRRSSYASVAAASRVRAASQRAAAAGVSVSYLLNPSSPGGDSRTSPTDYYYSPSSFEPASSDTMHRGHFYSSVGDYERNMLARAASEAVGGVSRAGTRAARVYTRQQQQQRRVVNQQQFTQCQAQPPASFAQGHNARRGGEGAQVHDRRRQRGGSESAAIEVEQGRQTRCVGCRGRGVRCEIHRPQEQQRKGP